MLEKIPRCAAFLFALAIGSFLMSCSATAPSAGDAVPEEPAAGTPAAAMIVQGRDLEAVVAAVEEVGGEITHRLRIINAVGARLTPAQIAVLEQHEAVTRIYQDREVGIRSTGSGPA